MSETYYFIKSRLNGYVLDVEGGSRDRGARVITWPQKSVHQSSNQQWVIENGLIKSRLNGYVLDIEGGNRDRGARVITWPQSGAHGSSNQQWVIENGLIKSKLNGYVLDIEGGSRDRGAQLITWPQSGAHGSSNQQWDLVPVPQDAVQTYKVKPTLSFMRQDESEIEVYGHLSYRFDDKDSWTALYSTTDNNPWVIHSFQEASYMRPSWTKDFGQIEITGPKGAEYIDFSTHLKEHDPSIFDADEDYGEGWVRITFSLGNRFGIMSFGKGQADDSNMSVWNASWRIEID